MFIVNVWWWLVDCEKNMYALNVAIANKELRRLYILTG